MNALDYALSKHPIIISVTDLKDLDKALEADSSIIILINADICTIHDVVNQVKETNKLIFVHIDLMKGLKKDDSSIEYLAKHVGVDGIVTTHAKLISIAKKFKLLTIQRVFILDTASIEQGLKSIQDSKPDAVEILPGIAVPHIQKKLKSNIHRTVIAAGLINSMEEIVYILKNGAKGISASATELWNGSSEVIKKLNINTHAPVGKL